MASYSPKSVSFVAGVFSLLAFSSIAAAQTNVCVVDVAKIFKNHAGYTAKMAELTNEAQTLQTKLQTIRGELVNLNQQLAALDAGSETYRQMENKIAHESANFEVERRNSTRELMIREAKLHFETYVEITQFVANYAEATNIRLVLRYNSQAMDANDPNSIMQRVNSNVVFKSNNRDITDKIVQRIQVAQGNATNSNR